jgi:hypothetical protein
LFSCSEAKREDIEMLQDSFTSDNYSSGVTDRVTLTSANVATAVVHSVFFLLTLGMLVVCYRLDRQQQRLQQRYVQSLKYCSEARTSFTLALMILYVFVETEAVLSAVKGSVWRVEIHVVNSLAICGTASCLMICALSLEVASVIFHFILTIYWSLCGTLEIMHLAHYTKGSLQYYTDSDVRILFSSGLLIVYICLVILEVIVLLHKVSIIYLPRPLACYKCASVDY